MDGHLGSGLASGARSDSIQRLISSYCSGLHPASDAASTRTSPLVASDPSPVPGLPGGHILTYHDARSSSVCPASARSARHGGTNAVVRWPGFRSRSIFVSSPRRKGRVELFTSPTARVSSSGSWPSTAIQPSEQPIRDQRRNSSASRLSRSARARTYARVFKPA